MLRLSPVVTTRKREVLLACWAHRGIRTRWPTTLAQHYSHVDGTQQSRPRQRDSSRGPDLTS